MLVYGGTITAFTKWDIEGCSEFRRVVLPDELKRQCSARCRQRAYCGGDGQKTRSDTTEHDVWNPSTKSGRESCAIVRMGMPGSASFQIAKKSLRQTHAFQEVEVARVGAERIHFFSDLEEL